VTEMVFTGQALLLAFALWRRPQRIMLVLAVAFALAVMAAAFIGREHRLPVIITLDTFVVVSMGMLVRRYHSDRARVVLWIGMLKIVFSVTAASLGLVQYARAASLNSAFVLQVLVAGGLADGIMAWLGNRAGMLGARLAGMRRSFWSR